MQLKHRQQSVAKPVLSRDASEGSGRQVRYDLRLGPLTGLAGHQRHRQWRGERLRNRALLLSLFPGCLRKYL